MGWGQGEREQEQTGGGVSQGKSKKHCNSSGKKVKAVGKKMGAERQFFLYRNQIDLSLWPRLSVFTLQ